MNLPTARERKQFDRGIPLWRAVSPEELEDVTAGDLQAFPLLGIARQNYYSATSLKHAIELARDWIAPLYGKAFVLQFRIDRKFLASCQIENQFDKDGSDLWISVDQLAAANSAILGSVKIVHQYPE